MKQVRKYENQDEGYCVDCGTEVNGTYARCYLCNLEFKKILAKRKVTVKPVEPVKLPYMFESDDE